MFINTIAAQVSQGQNPDEIRLPTGEILRGAKEENGKYAIQNGFVVFPDGTQFSGTGVYENGKLTITDGNILNINIKNGIYEKGKIRIEARGKIEGVPVQYAENIQKTDRGFKGIASSSGQPRVKGAQIEPGTLFEYPGENNGLKLTFTSKSSRAVIGNMIHTFGKQNGGTIEINIDKINNQIVYIQPGMTYDHDERVNVPSHHTRMPVRANLFPVTMETTPTNEHKINLNDGTLSVSQNGNSILTQGIGEKNTVTVAQDEVKIEGHQKSALVTDNIKSNIFVGSQEPGLLIIGTKDPTTTIEGSNAAGTVIPLYAMYPPLIFNTKVESSLGRPVEISGEKINFLFPSFKQPNSIENSVTSYSDIVSKPENIFGFKENAKTEPTESHDGHSHGNTISSGLTSNSFTTSDEGSNEIKTFLWGPSKAYIGLGGEKSPNLELLFQPQDPREKGGFVYGVLSHSDHSELPPVEVGIALKDFLRFSGQYPIPLPENKGSLGGHSQHGTKSVSAGFTKKLGSFNFVIRGIYLFGEKNHEDHHKEAINPIANPKENKEHHEH
ncbi:MAG TPA: hypothetical protein VI564_05155 [Candidatus Nanoarchaeia archaeon]|nr:hypothetical protein [Candidatus Nanoarchaeia archaeon]